MDSGAGGGRYDAITITPLDEKEFRGSHNCMSSFLQRHRRHQRKIIDIMMTLYVLFLTLLAYFLLLCLAVALLIDSFPVPLLSPSQVGIRF